MKPQSRSPNSQLLALLVVLFGLALPGLALDSSDLLFHLPFEGTALPELARGAPGLHNTPENSAARITDGAIGKGYKFSGPGSTLEFLSAGNPAGAEMYGAKGNLFGNEGTVAYWTKHLSNSNDLHHDFFKFGGNGAYRDLYSVYYFSYNGIQGQMYNTKYPFDVWMHWAVSWHKGESRRYLNGKLWGVTTDCGVVEKAPETFTVAAQGIRSIERQTKDLADDTVMDEFQLFGRALTDEEIRSLFERGHVTAESFWGSNGLTPVVEKPSRSWQENLIQAPAVTTSIKVDADLADWKGIPGNGGFIERRVGVLDSDPSVVYAASDAANLYLAFRCPVDKSLQDDPTHIKYPNGEFKASPYDRDGDVYADDYVEFLIVGKDGRQFRFALNGKGSLQDSLNGDKAWNSQAQFAGRSDLKDWTAEIAIPLAEIGAAAGDRLGFNVIRSWKWFRSSQNALCADAGSQPLAGGLVLGATAAAGLETLGNPGSGVIEAQGWLTGPAGEYTVKLQGTGLEQKLTKETKVTVAQAPVAFNVSAKLEKPGDMGLVVEVSDPAGKPVLVRSLPFVYVGGARTEVRNYPGWGKADVKVTPVDRTGLMARLAIEQAGKAYVQAEIPSFPDPAAQVRIDTGKLAVGDYELVVRLFRGKTQVGEDRQPFRKTPRPEWVDSQVGIIDTPPVPWTDVKVSGSTVNLLIKKIEFAKTLFPAQITSNGQAMLAEPIRIRFERNGKDGLITTGSFKFTKRTSRRAAWEATGKDGDLRVKVSGWIEFDGFTWMDITLSGGKVDYLGLEIPFRKDAVTLQNMQGKGLVGDKPLRTAGCGPWVGNEKAGFQYWWEDQLGWELSAENKDISAKLLRGWELVEQPIPKDTAITLTPGETMTMLSIPLIQKPVDLKKPRTITLGWAITPTKPLRKDWRDFKLNMGISYTTSYYTMATPNYPQAMPGETAENLKASLASLNKLQNTKLVMWYTFGPFIWVGAPEYAEYYHEWSVSSWPEVPPNPNSQEWGWACHQSSGSNLFLYKLDKYMKDYPQRACYVDCYFMMACSNEAHGCGYVDENGKRQMSPPLLATRKHYERLYNIIKSYDPKYGWLRIHDWGPIMPVAAFCDENWSGEGLITPIGNTPEKNYYRVVDMPYVRVEFLSSNFGHFQSFLTELGCSAGMDPKKREEWYGKMVTPPKDGKPGTWILPKMKDYEHVAGLALIHDMWSFGGNDAGISAGILTKMMRDMKWDDSLQFIGYWDLGGALTMDGGVPEKVVCSVYYQPAGKDAQGNPTKAWLMLAPMNNTDEDVTVTLKPNLAKFGLQPLANGRLRDMYRATSYVYTFAGILNPGDPEQPHIEIPGVEEVYPVTNGEVTLKLEKRNFKALLLEVRP